jgi:tetratricopeptide (TPR) repeat protein/TolB-like protein
VGLVLFQNTATQASDAFLGRAVGIRLADAIVTTGAISMVASEKFGYEALTTPRGAKTVAAVLGVRYILGGRVGRTQTGEISVVAELRRPSDGAVVWGLSRSTTMSGLPRLVDQIAAGVVGAVKDANSAPYPASGRLAAWGNDVSAEVVEHFMRGTYYSSLNTISGYERALAQFDSAAKSDPGFAPAFASAGLTIATMLEWGWWDYGSERVGQLTERGLAATDRALKLDSASAKAWMARGSLLAFRNPRTYAGAFPAFRRAIAIAPGDAEAHHWYGRALMQVGERGAARSQFEKALELAPADARVLFDFAQLYRHDGSLNRACILLDSAVAASPTAAQIYVLRALTRARRGELRFAWADAETGGRLGWPYWSQSASAIVDAASRDTTGARERTNAIRKAVAKTGTRPQEWTGEYLAAALAAGGDRDRALDLLEKIRPRGARLWFALTGPDFAPLKREPRYRTLVAASRPRR